MFNIQFLVAQSNSEFKPYVFATGGVAININLFLPDSRFEGLPTKKTPVYDLTLQYRGSKHITFGACMARQQLVSTDTSAGFGVGAYYIFNLYNVGVVASYNAQLSKNFDFYFQTKLNYQILQTQLQYVDNSNGINSKVTVPMQNPNAYNFQFGIGFNYYFAKSLGLNTEAAIGSPYFFKLGINYRLFTNGTPANERKIKREEPIKGKNFYN